MSHLGNYFTRYVWLDCSPSHCCIHRAEGQYQQTRAFLSVRYHSTAPLPYLPTTPPPPPPPPRTQETLTAPTSCASELSRSAALRMFLLVGRPRRYYYYYDQEGWQPVNGTRRSAANVCSVAAVSRGFQWPRAGGGDIGNEKDRRHGSRVYV